MVDQGIVDGDDALVAVAGRGVFLEEFQAALVERLDVPVGVGEEAVEAGLVGGLGELPVDAEDVLAVGDEQAGEVLGEVAALGLVGEEVAVLEGFLNDLGELDDASHEQMLRTPFAPGENRSKSPPSSLFLQSRSSSLQNSRLKMKSREWRMETLGDRKSINQFAFCRGGPGGCPPRPPTDPCARN